MAHLSLILSQINWAVSIQHQASDPAPRSLIHCSVYLAPAPVLQSINDRSSLPGHWLVYCSISWSQDQSTCHAILFTNLRIFEFISLQFNVQCSFVISNEKFNPNLPLNLTPTKLCSGRCTSTNPSKPTHSYKEDQKFKLDPCWTESPSCCPQVYCC